MKFKTNVTTLYFQTRPQIHPLESLSLKLGNRASIKCLISSSKEFHLFGN